MGKVITLAIDTCDGRGSVAVRCGGRLLAIERHESDEDYSSWLLPAVHDALKEASCTLKDAGVLAVATGPGSFTGLRVGLATAKAWAEVYGIPVVGISRLEALANRGAKNAEHIAAYYDAQRGQIFGGLFRKGPTGVELVEAEAVLEPGAFLSFVEDRCARNAVSWVTLDAELISRQAKWEGRAARGDTLYSCTEGLADSIGELGERRAQRGEFSDPVALDANYVRRSDAELFWKGNSRNGS